MFLHSREIGSKKKIKYKVRVSKIKETVTY